MTDLRQAAQQALEALAVAWQQNPHWQITEGMHALRAALAQQAEQDHNTRAEFERWAASYSTFCLEREDDAALGTAGYKSVEQTMLWHAWQAAKTNAPVGAFGGKSGANTRLGLAGADCTHEFAVAATSGISICTKCGLSEMVARKRAVRAALAQQAEPVAERERIATQWDGCVTHQLDTFGPVDIGASIRAGELVGPAQQAEPVGCCEECGMKYCECGERK